MGMSLLIVAVAKSFDWVGLLKDVGIPLFLGCIGWLGGRKSTTEKKKSEIENFKLEIESFKSMRELLIEDNKSLVSEIKEMRKEMSDLKIQLNELSKNNCTNSPTCQNRRTQI